MNLYFLVEGRRTERRVYPSWLSTLVPELRQVHRFDEVSSHTYFLLSGEGYPSLLNTHLPNAVADIRHSGRYTHLVVCLDADESTPAEREAEVLRAIAQNDLDLGSVQLQVVVQNRCIESWFLGNRRVIARNPQSQRLREYLAFYDVTLDDPESMGVHPEFRLHAPFHHDYLREALREKQLVYSKARPGHVCDATFLEALRARVAAEPHHLPTFAAFVSFCEKLRASVRS